LKVNFEISGVNIVRILLIAAVFAVIGYLAYDNTQLTEENARLTETQSLLSPPPDTVLLFNVTMPDSTDAQLPMLTYKKLYDALFGGVEEVKPSN